ncbi:MAG: substrate-binding domain-containing protein [Pyrinomonadaceae bacterium]
MYLRFLRIGSITLIAFCIFGCTRTDQPTIAEKHYIEPPRQEKIAASTTALRVCSDPNNLPFSNQQQEGFENKIADLIAADMHVPVEYTWWAQRRGFFRSTLRAGVCDIVMGIPNGFELADTTRPYYRSTYVFVSRADRDLDLKSFDDPRLRDVKIGVQLIGDDGANSPPVHALNNRGMVANLKGFTLYGNYREPNPPARIIDAVVKKDVDVAVVWGPLAGYFGKKQHTPLSIAPVSPQIDLPYLPFVFDISVAVRRGDDDLRNKINEILTRRQGDIDRILDEYNIPRVDAVHMAAMNRKEEK